MRAVQNWALPGTCVLTESMPLCVYITDIPLTRTLIPFSFSHMNTGAVVKRGLTCSRRQYRAFLRRCLLPPDSSFIGSGSGRGGGGGGPSLWDDEEEEEEPEEAEDELLRMGLSGGGGGGASLPSRPWEGLRMRVERGVRYVRACMH